MDTQQSEIEKLRDQLYEELSRRHGSIGKVAKEANVTRQYASRVLTGVDSVSDPVLEAAATVLRRLKEQELRTASAIRGALSIKTPSTQIAA